MFKQTVLKFQGALGLLGFGPKDEEEDGDSGNSATQGSWDDDENDEKSIYLSTGVLRPTGQAVSEIKVTSHSIAGIKALLDAYQPKRSNVQQYCRVFDTKELITKQDIESKIWTKVPPQDVRSLALDAVKLAQAKQIDREEIKEAS